MTAPEPAVIQRGNDWTVDVQYEHLQQIMLRNQAGQMKRYWYVILTVTNNTGEDVDFYPKCELMTDTYQIVPSGRHVPGGVFEYIRNRYSTTYPFIENLSPSGTKVLQGENNTRDFVILWPDFDPQAKEVKFFISGLSNETAAVSHPSQKDELGNPKKVFLRKTLQLDYKISGDPEFRALPKLSFLERSWVMR